MALRQRHSSFPLLQCSWNSSKMSVSGPVVAETPEHFVNTYRELATTSKQEVWAAQLDGRVKRKTTLLILYINYKRNITETNRRNRKNVLNRINRLSSIAFRTENVTAAATLSAARSPLILLSWCSMPNGSENDLWIRLKPNMLIWLTAWRQPSLNTNRFWQSIWSSVLFCLRRLLQGWTNQQWKAEVCVRSQASGITHCLMFSSFQPPTCLKHLPHSQVVRCCVVNTGIWLFSSSALAYICAPVPSSLYFKFIARFSYHSFSANSAIMCDGNVRI